MSYFSAGYDIVNDLDGVLEEFDKVIGIERLKTVHLNDSMMPFGDKRQTCSYRGRKDRIKSINWFYGTS